MTPEEQSKLAHFLGEILPPGYYPVVNGEFVEVHKKEIIEEEKPMPTLFDEKGY